jgi:hypothetical protein
MLRCVATKLVVYRKFVYLFMDVYRAAPDYASLKVLQEIFDTIIGQEEFDAGSLPIFRPSKTWAITLTLVSAPTTTIATSCGSTSYNSTNNRRSKCSGSGSDTSSSSSSSSSESRASSSSYPSPFSSARTYLSLSNFGNLGLPLDSPIHRE